MSSSRFVGEASGRLSAGTEPRYGTPMSNLDAGTDSGGWKHGGMPSGPAVGGPPFVGRRTELGALTSVLGRLRHGRGGIALVTGGAGIGKSRLVATALDNVTSAEAEDSGDPVAGTTGRDADRVRRVPSRPADAAALAGVPCRRISLPLGGSRRGGRRGGKREGLGRPRGAAAADGRRRRTAAAARRSARAGTASRCSATSSTTSSRRRGRHRSCWSSRTCTGRTRRLWRCFGCSLRSWPGARSSSSRPRVRPRMTTTRRRSPG